jgi:hypothetical protein
MVMVDDGRKVFRRLSLIADRVRVGGGRGGRGLGGKDDWMKKR